MSDSTTTTAKVTASVMDQYRRVDGGEAASKVAKDLGISPSTVSANVKRVRGHIEAGHTLEVEGEATVNLTASAPAVDPHEVAEAMVEGASIVTRNLATVEAEGDAIRVKADRLRAQADTLTGEAEALITKAMPRIEAVANALGFDLNAWREAVTEAEAEASKVPTDEAKAEADSK